MKEWCYYFILAKRLGRETYPDMSNTLGTSVCGMCVCTQICVYILPYAMQNQGTLLLFGEFGAWITHNRKNGSGAPSCDQCFQFSSVAQSCPTLCDPMDCSTTGFPGHHQPPELAQAHVHPVSDAIPPSHPLSSPSPPALNLSQHQALFQWVSSSHQAKVLKSQLQHQSFQWIFRADFL